MSAKTETSEKKMLERWDKMNTFCNKTNQKIRPKSRIEQLLYFLQIFISKTKSKKTKNQTKKIHKQAFEDICSYLGWSC